MTTLLIFAAHLSASQRSASPRPALRRSATQRFFIWQFAAASRRTSARRYSPHFNATQLNDFIRQFANATPHRSSPRAAARRVAARYNSTQLQLQQEAPARKFFFFSPAVHPQPVSTAKHRGKPISNSNSTGLKP